MKRHFNPLLIVAALCCLFVASTSLRAADVPAKDKDAAGESKATTKEGKEEKKPESNKKADAKALANAMIALNKEYELFEKDPTKNPLRAEPNYFKDNPVDVSPEDVLAVLDKPVKGNSRAEAYVKWQLTALLPDKLDSKDEPRLLKIYQRAPKPLPIIGAGKQQQQKWAGEVARLGKNQEFDFNEKYLDLQAKSKAVDTPIVAYRNALYTHLTPSYESLLAGFGDAYDRLQAGLDTDPFLPQVITSVSTWSMDAKPREVAQMNELVKKIMQLPSADVYTGIKAKDAGGYEWQKSQSTMNEGNRLGLLQKDLEERAKAAPAGGEVGGKGLKMKNQ